MIIGVDFDNTIVSYDSLIYEIAIERCLIGTSSVKSKKLIRDTIRTLPNGDIEWQKVQAVIYGQEINRARVIRGVQTFFKKCKTNGVKTFIISHKTQFSNFDSSKTNLRTAALNWMRENRVFDPSGFGLNPTDVCFESTRAGKVDRIKALNCTHFIDDLEETFLEPTFPSGVDKILYASHAKNSSIEGVKVKNSWKEIRDYLFGTNR